MKKFLIIDAHALIHRMFHAIPPLSNKEGEPTGALYGVANVLIKILKKEHPDYIAAAFDTPQPTFRKKIFEEYKAHRPKAEDALISQLIKSRELFDTFGIPVIEAPGYEADDIIGTLATKFSKKTKVIIFTGDLDALQLVKDGAISVITFKKGISEMIEYNELAVKNRFGVPPEKVVDWKGLVGDSSDNIPGVKGIGPKSAEKLLNTYGSIDGILTTKNPDVLAKKIQENSKEVKISRTLSEIKRDVPISTNNIESFQSKSFSKEKIIHLFKQLGFESIIKREGWEEENLFKNEDDKKNNYDEKKLFIINNNDLDNIKEKINTKEFKKIAYDWKTLWKKNNSEFEIDNSFFDVMIAAWLLEPDTKKYSWEDISKKYGNATELLPSKNELEIIYNQLSLKIEKYELKKVLEEIEMPLIPILGKMELIGIRTNIKKLEKLKKQIEEETITLEKEIFALAGTTFNIRSPQQISNILFEKIGLGGKKKTKTGLISTKEDVLFEFQKKHPIVPLILHHRENSKIMGTYLDPYISLSKEKNPIIHTSFIQTGTATGRLASEKPNLQNIPQESKWSQSLRDIFEASPGYSFISFDYSQLELRILAHASQDKNLIQAFKNGRDIHSATAEKIFHKKNISPNERRMAKTLNFGIVYGMGPRAFSKQAGISFMEAQKHIEDYFFEFNNVKKWQEKEKNKAKNEGFVETATGRKRWFQKERGFFEIERAAINAPIQGLAADIMKLALINVDKKIKKTKENIKIILTIHDELIVEAQDDILKTSEKIIANIMENVFSLEVPLIVNTKIGKTLGTMKKNI